MAPTVLLVFILSINLSSCATTKQTTNTSTSASTEIEPYADEEFPEWMKLARRTEIITIGSIPFITFQATLGYTIFRYFDHNMNSAYFPNPLAKDSTTANLNSDEQANILKYSCMACVAIGITDLAINAIKDKIANDRLKKQNMISENIVITPQDEALLKDAVQLPLPNEINDAGD